MLYSSASGPSVNGVAVPMEAQIACTTCSMKVPLVVTRETCPFCFKTEISRILAPSFVPDLITGDLDSIRPSVREFYENQNVQVIEDHDQDSTDLMKCLWALAAKEEEEASGQYEVIFLGGISGRLDQTVHTLHYIHKLRKTRSRVFVITDETIGWVLDEGEHLIHIDHNIMGPTCGLLPVGVDSSVLSTAGLRWNLTERRCSFDGLVSTSNHVVPEEPVVWVKTSRPIWWCVELKALD